MLKQLQSSESLALSVVARYVVVQRIQITCNWSREDILPNWSIDLYIEWAKKVRYGLDSQDMLAFLLEHSPETRDARHNDHRQYCMYKETLKRPLAERKLPSRKEEAKPIHFQLSSM